MLNQWLYERLREIFGDVRVINEGLPLEYHFMYTIEGKRQRRILQRGECYAVNCPYCALTCGRPDTRKRLYINHKWGTSDSNLGSTLDLIHCYNENCFSNPETRKTFFNFIYQNVGELPIVVFTTPAMNINPSLPTGFSLSELPENHPARRFLLTRRFDVTYIEKTFFAYYGYDKNNPNATHRLIIPIYQNGEIRGWQGRALDDRQPKYYTAPRTSLGGCLYGYDQYKCYKNTLKGRAVLVEGPFDVWRIGPGALGLFGKTINMQRKHLLLSLGIREIVLCLDGDVGYDELLSKKLSLEESGFHVTVMKLPDAFDPADLSLEEVAAFRSAIWN